MILAPIAGWTKEEERRGGQETEADMFRQWHRRKQLTMRAAGFGSWMGGLTLRRVVRRSKRWHIETDAIPRRGCFRNGTSTRRAALRKSPAKHWPSLAPCRPADFDLHHRHRSRRSGRPARLRHALVGRGQFCAYRRVERLGRGGGRQTRKLTPSSRGRFVLTAAHRAACRWHKKDVLLYRFSGEFDRGQKVECPSFAAFPTTGTWPESQPANHQAGR